VWAKCTTIRTASSRPLTYPLIFAGGAAVPRHDKT
jgi:hypothetical protein